MDDNITKIKYEITLYSIVTKKYTVQLDIPVDDEVSDYIGEAWDMVDFNNYDSIEEDEDYEYDEIGYITEEDEIFDATADAEYESKRDDTYN